MGHLPLTTDTEHTGSCTAWNPLRADLQGQAAEKQAWDRSSKKKP